MESFRVDCSGQSAKHGVTRVRGLVAIVAVVAATATITAAGASATAYVRAITDICSGALLFEGRHNLGARAGALAVARDIRLSTRDRLDRVGAVQVPHRRERLVERWMGLERRLADVYAESWVAMFDAVDAADTPRQRVRLPALLNRLLHAPDRLRLAAAKLERALIVPECRGGGQTHAPATVTDRRTTRPSAPDET